MTIDSSYTNYAGGTGETGPAGPAGPAGATGPAGPAGDLEILTDVDSYATQQWPGPFTVTGGIGAPTSGTGNVGEYYIDGTNPAIGVLYGPKQEDNTWPLIGNQNAAWFANTLDPVDGTGYSDGVYYLKFSFTPPSTITLISIWGPYTNAGVSDRSYLGYDQSTRTWKATSGEYILSTEGGATKALATSATGSYVLVPSLASSWELTLTGNTSFAAFPIGTPRHASGETRLSHLIVTLKQGGSGGYTVTWPAAITWPGGNAPTLSTRVGDVDVFHLISYDRGTNWYGQQIVSGTGPQRVEKVSDKTADYTFARTDAGNIVTLSGADNRTFTVPTNASVPLPVGTRITIATTDTGHITVAGDTGVTVTGTTTLNTAGHVGTLIKIGTNSWIVHV